MAFLIIPLPSQKDSGLFDQNGGIIKFKSQSPAARFIRRLLAIVSTYRPAAGVPDGRGCRCVSHPRRSAGNPFSGDIPPPHPLSRRTPLWKFIH
jgi:hypothetical protein